MPVLGERSSTSALLELVARNTALVFCYINISLQVKCNVRGYHSAVAQVEAAIRIESGQLDSEIRKINSELQKIASYFQEKRAKGDALDR